MSNISLVPQALGIGADGTDQNLMQILAARRLAQAQGQSGGLGKAGGQPAFAPRNGRQAGLGYALVAGNALLERMEANKQKQAQSAGAEQTAAVLRGLGGQFKNITGAQVLGMSIMPGGQEMLKQLMEASTRAPQSVSAGSSLVGNDGRAVYQAPHAPVTLSAGQQLFQPGGGGQAPSQPAPSALAVPGGPAPQAPAAPQQGGGGGQVLASVPRQPDDLRKEFQGLQSTKDMNLVGPLFTGLKESAARDNRASDLSLIYGFAKMADPGSAVRGEEMTMVQAISTLPEQIRATVMSQISGTGRLSPDVREALMQEMSGKAMAFQSAYQNNENMYRDLATRGSMEPNDVLPRFEPLQPYAPNRVGPQGAQDQARGVVGESAQMPLPPMRPQEMGQSPAGPMPAPVAQRPAMPPPAPAQPMPPMSVYDEQMRQNQGIPGSELQMPNDPMAGIDALLQKYGGAR